MTIVAVVPALVAVVGALLYALTGPKIAEIGRAMLWCGLLVTLVGLAGHVVRL